MTTQNPPKPSVNPSKETFFSWIGTVFKAAMKELPKRAKGLAIQLGIVLFFQFAFWWRVTNPLLPTFISGPIIFLTATYTDVIPKTIYWIIIFTFGKRLFCKIQKQGLKEALRPIKQLKPELMNSITALRQKAYSTLLIGAGIGLIIANNFASYSRYSGARNKFDKYFIAIVISFTISYLLGEGRKHWIFKMARLIFADLAKALKLKFRYTDYHTYVLLSGFIAGLLLDAPLIMMQSMYGGYLLGFVLLGIAVVMGLIGSVSGKKDAKALG